MKNLFHYMYSTAPQPSLSDTDSAPLAGKFQLTELTIFDIWHLEFFGIRLRLRFAAVTFVCSLSAGRSDSDVMRGLRHGCLRLSQGHQRGGQRNVARFQSQLHSSVQLTFAHSRLGQLRWRLGLIARQSPSPVHQGPRPIRFNSIVQFGANTHS